MDTGSERSFIKKEILTNNCRINSSKMIYLKEIRGDLVETLSSIEINVFGYTASFQEVPYSFPIPCKRVLGAEIFEKSGLVLDYNNTYLKVGIKRINFKRRNPEAIVGTLVDSNNKESVNENLDTGRGAISNSSINSQTFTSDSDDSSTDSRFEKGSGIGMLYDKTHLNSYGNLLYGNTELL